MRRTRGEAARGLILANIFIEWFNYSVLVEVDRTGRYKHCIKPGLVKTKDYRGVNQRIWSFFRYGGGPQIVCARVDMYSRARGRPGAHVVQGACGLKDG
jgi:hypothetical protein